MLLEGEVLHEAQCFFFNWINIFSIISELLKREGDEALGELAKQQKQRDLTSLDCSK